jgi:hypothetical protein
MGVHRTASALNLCAIGLLLALGATGCTTSSHRSSFPTSSSHPQSTARTAQDSTTENSAVLAAYSGMWNDLANASHTANWRDTSLKDHATGEALAEILSGLYSLSQKGLVSKGAPVLHPHVTSSTASTADVRDCASSTNWLSYVAATGKLENNVPGGNRVIEAHVELADGAWRVTFYAVGALGSC